MSFCSVLSSSLAEMLQARSESAGTENQLDWTAGAGSGAAAANALRLPMVLDKIAKHLAAVDIITIRGTCRDWNRAFILQINRVHKPMELDSSKLLDNLNQLLLGQSPPANPSFISFSYHISDGLHFNWKALQSSFSSSSPGANSGRRLLIGLIRSVVALEKLKLKIHSAGESTSLLDLGRIRPGLLIKHMGLYTLAMKGEIQGAYVHEPNSIQLQRVKLGNLSPRYYDADVAATNLNSLCLETLQQAPAHANILEFKLGCPFSDAHSSSSVQMALSRPPHSRQLNLTVSRMDKLRTFRISGSSERFEVGYEAETFASNFPSLETIELDLECSANKNFCDSVQHPRLKHLISRKNLTAGWMGRFAATLPALTNLEINISEVSSTTFYTIWESWPGLEELCIHFHYRDAEGGGRGPIDLDEQLTGMESWTFPELKKELAASMQPPYNLDVINVLAFPYKTTLGISDLTHLHKFVLNLYTNSYDLTDFGGLFGLAIAGKRGVLKHLEINRVLGEVRPATRWPLVTGHCLALIREAMGPLAYIKLE